MKPSIFRPIQIVLFSFLSLVVLGLVLSAWLTLREQQRLHAAQTQLEQLHEFQRVYVLVGRRLVIIAHGTPDEPTARVELSQHVEELIHLAVNPDTPGKLQAFRVQVQQSVAGQRGQLLECFVMYQDIAETERAGQAQLLASLEGASRSQRNLELAAPLAILAVGFLLIPITRRRLVKPLEAFGRQLHRLARGEFTPMPHEESDPLVLPLHRQFNELVRRLRELEAAHQTRTDSLEAEVRAATRTLLEQHRSLARAERLAATGELAASVAHELRNPLAGIQMTLSNLRADLDDPEIIERVDLVVTEVTRLSRLLNELLDTSRHAPEPARTVHLAQLVDEVLTLTRCQLATEIRLESRIDPALTCRLPQDRLRQAVLNLVLNAAAALADRGGSVTVGAESVGPQIRITVSDDGPGFPAEMLERGIQPFFSTRQRGTGLGLAMVRRFARDVGGDVVLSNRPPHGACVTLLLPSEADDGRHAVAR